MVGSSTPLPINLQSSTSNNLTKIAKTPISYKGHDFLTSAAKWTKSKLFNGDSASNGHTPPYTSQSVDSHGAPGANGSAVEHPETQPQSCVRVCPGGYVMIRYSSCVQVWMYDSATEDGVLTLVGSTRNVEGTVVEASMISTESNDPKDILLVLHIEYEGNDSLQVHSAIKDPSLVHTLVLPPSSSGPGPYSIFTESDIFLSVVNSAGLVTVFSLTDYSPLPISGISVEFAPGNGPPLFDMRDRWLVLAPKDSNTRRNRNLPSSPTPVKLPPSGPLVERLLDNLSSTAVSSIKSLSDAGYSGIKYYLNKDNQAMPTEKKGGVAVSSLKTLRKLLFTEQGDDILIQIIDIRTRSTIGCFAPLEGLSHLSLSPHDATLATVSSKGDRIYTYDLSFVPQQVVVTGRYSRGKVPARVCDVCWDDTGALGITTMDKGTLHWFDKKLSFDTSSYKLWKLSGWGIQQAVFLHNASGERELLVLRGDSMVVVEPSTGRSYWKYDIPTTAVDEGALSDTLLSEQRAVGSNNQALNNDGLVVDPLANYELETCLPYPLFHEDRRIVISTATFDTDVSGYNDADDHPPSIEVFGCDIDSVPVDFGNARGKAKFPPSADGSGGEEDPDVGNEELRLAMESMVLNDPVAGLDTSSEDSGIVPIPQ